MFSFGPKDEHVLIRMNVHLFLNVLLWVFVDCEGNLEELHLTRDSLTDELFVGQCLTGETTFLPHHLVPLTLLSLAQVREHVLVQSGEDEGGLRLRSSDRLRIDEVFVLFCKPLAHT